MPTYFDESREYASIIESLVAQSLERPFMHGPPAQLESWLCAMLACWEAVRTRREAPHAPRRWFDYWREECARRGCRSWQALADVAKDCGADAPVDYEAIVSGFSTVLERLRAAYDVPGTAGEIEAPAPVRNRLRDQFGVELAWENEDDA
jgi:hypothetical protein